MASIGASSTVRTPLLKEECGREYLSMEGITTATFFGATIDRAVLDARCAALLAANPWLGGRLSKEKKEERVHLVHGDVSPAVLFERVVVHAEVVPDGPKGKMPKSVPLGRVRSVDPTMSAMEIGARLSDTPTTVTPGSKLIKSGDAVCRITFAPWVAATGPAQPPNDPHRAQLGSGGTVMIFSLSHAVADGGTYYMLVNMLMDGATPQPLAVDRVDAFSEQVYPAIGEDKKKWMESTGVMANIVGTIVFKKAPTVVVFPVDNDRVATIKQAAVAAKRVVYVSTNDIVTSAFCRATDADWCMMAINMRRRLPCLPDANVAGNYEYVLHYTRSDFASPSLIRASLTPVNGVYRGAGEPQEKLPGCWGAMRLRPCMITNWATDAADVMMISGTEDVLHVPVVSTTMTGMNFGIIFRAHRGQTALMMFGWKATLDAMSTLPETPFAGPW